MADIKAAFNSKAALTITLASLAANGKRQALAVDNSSGLFLDALVSGKVKTGASVDKPGWIDLYVAGSIDGGTVYSGDASGTDAAYSGPIPNLHFLGRISAGVKATTYEFGPFSVAKAFGGVLPTRWTVILDNQTHGVLDATGGSHEIQYQEYFRTTT